MEHESALSLVGEIYDAAQEPDRWPELLLKVADFCGGANAALVSVDPDIGYSSVITPRAKPESLAAYNAHWWRHDPITELASKAAPGTLVSVADTDREAYFKSAFYNEFRRFTGYGDYGVTTPLFRKGRAFANFVLQTSPKNDELDARTLRNLRMLVPHLARSVAIARRLHRLELERSVSDFSLRSDHAGLILVDANRRRLFADEAGEDLLASTPQLRHADGHIRLSDPKADRRLNLAVQACIRLEGDVPSGDQIQFCRHEGLTPLTLEVLPFRKNRANPHGLPAAALLLIRDPSLERKASAETLRDRYGLTPAEAALAVEMLKGDGRAAAAERCGISINTARTHLMRIFEKTGVTRQAELIRVLLDA